MWLRYLLLRGGWAILWQDWEGSRRVQRDGGERKWLFVWDAPPPRSKCLEVSGNTTQLSLVSSLTLVFLSHISVGLTQTGEEARRPGESKGASVPEQGGDSDAPGFRGCCMPLDHGFYLSPQWSSCAEGTQRHRSADTLPRGWVLMHPALWCFPAHISRP